MRLQTFLRCKTILNIDIFNNLLELGKMFVIKILFLIKEMTIQISSK